MPNYYLELSYDGSHYRGYQRQPGGVRTIQETLENTLTEVLGRTTTIGGCGRTDAGVHATRYFAHLRLEEPARPNFLFVLNKRLPTGIAVRALHPVSDKAQARYDATHRTYDYYAHFVPDARLDQLSTLLGTVELDYTAIHAALALLPRYTDYYAFCKTPARHNTTLCHFSAAELSLDGTGQRLRFRFTANRFLRGMIRLLVNDLLDVGRGKLPAADFERMLVTRARTGYFRLAPPEGLYLTGVGYPYLELGVLVPVGGW